jgi:hypothetical protein
METAAWFTVGIAGLIIAATALGLTRVILHLFATQRTLSQVLGGVEAVDARTSTVPAVVSSVNESLRPVREFTDTV